MVRVHKKKDLHYIVAWSLGVEVGVNNLACLGDGMLRYWLRLKLVAGGVTFKLSWKGYQTLCHKAYSMLSLSFLLWLTPVVFIFFLIQKQSTDEAAKPRDGTPEPPNRSIQPRSPFQVWKSSFMIKTLQLQYLRLFVREIDYSTVPVQ